MARRFQQVQQDPIDNSVFIHWWVFYPVQIFAIIIIIIIIIIIVIVIIITLWYAHNAI